MTGKLLDRLASGFVLGDGGYLMGLRLRGFVKAGAMTPQVVVTHPEEVEKLTREFFDAGAEVLQTLTFFGTSNMLAPAGFGEQAEEINRTACRIARVVGVNCICPPQDMLAAARHMRGAVDVPICCQPSAWHSWWGKPAVEPEAFGAFAQDAAEADIRYLGSCCGAGPEHVRAMAGALGKAVS